VTSFESIRAVMTKKKLKQNKDKFSKLQQGSFERFLKDDKDI